MDEVETHVFSIQGYLSPSLAILFLDTARERRALEGKFRPMQHC
jgi:hypothetical protein